jgi:hypothetical protein
MLCVNRPFICPCLRSSLYCEILSFLCCVLHCEIQPFLHCVLHRGLRVVQGNVVGVVIRYGLDDPRSNSRWWRDFPHPWSPALVSTQPPLQRVLNHYRKVKRPGRDVKHPPPSSAKGKEVWSHIDIPRMACSRVKLPFYPYLYRRV